MIDPLPTEAETVGPWKRLESKILYDNAWIRLREDQVIHPHGEAGIYGVVEFKNLAVGVVPVDGDGNVHLVGQHRYPLNYYSWEIPEGGCKPHAESPLGAAKRELKEETGLMAEQWDYLGCFAISNSVTNEICHLFLARNFSQTNPDPDPTEILQNKKMPLAEACLFALEGGLSESLTLIGLLRAQHFLAHEAAGHSPLLFKPTL